MKLKFRLKIKDVIAVDPETKNTWSGKKVIESELTPFVAKKLSQGILELVEDKGKGDSDV